MKFSVDRHGVTRLQSHHVHHLGAKAARGVGQAAGLRSALPVPQYLDVFGQCVEMRLESGDSFELNVQLESYLNQEGFDPRQSPRNWLDNGGNDGRNSSPTVGVRFWYLGTLLADGNSSVFCLAHFGLN